MTKRPPQTHLIILAAGNGTRMVSKKPKVMHDIAGLPLLGHVLKATQELSSVVNKASVTITVVLAPAMTDVAGFVNSFEKKARIAYQKEQLGTAHAVSCALEGLSLQEDDTVIILFGDTPLIKTSTITTVRDFLSAPTQQETVAGVMVVGMTPPDPNSYGRLVCDQTGKLLKIVEFKHASDAEKEITFCNSGIMAFKASCLQKVIPDIKVQQVNGEYYLTDAIEAARRHGFDIQTLEVPFEEVEGVNTQRDLAQAEARYQNRRRLEFLDLGCAMVAPETVYFSHDTVIESNVTLEPNLFFGPQVTLKSGSLIKAFSHIEGALVEENATIGPFARLRPGTTIGQEARVGNFVEVKNTTFASGAKANHLSYVGDATVGAKANIGAGTITCNYDGYFKHKTEIGEGAFIGSNSCLVAPVSIGRNAIIGAASTITKTVEDDELAVARAPQKAFANKAKKIHETKLKLKKQRVA
ncbi:MAG TPA: bifunctional UDP-N-acetylglucosamine diphosphorylase/glucosamine-1-phosphate N-acetyltransferase GlmU [Holosporales bacterium]|nr:bifunctional UDP-N-acetylglucosamine diphosphorylase/glucosamine-1-phosphate N-acetyltransferase GlmU [Holosporales bacterium]